MLEQRQLLLGPWVLVPPDEGSASGRRPVLDAATGAPLGHVCWQASHVPAWLAWLAQPVLAVYETEDASLVCTVRRLVGLGSSWKVADADDRAVGLFRHVGVRGPVNEPCRGVPAVQLADPSGHRFARFDPGPGRFVSERGDELATLGRSEKGHVLTFARRSEGNPFVRMLLLAAVLPLAA
jgi:hypothetical protein